jgi:hypothetical protein
MRLQRSIASDIIQTGQGLTKGLVMLVQTTEGRSFESAPRNLIRPAEIDTITGTPPLLSSNSFGFALDFSLGTFLRYLYNNADIDETKAITVLTLLTTDSLTFSTPIHLNKSASGFRLMCNADGGANVALVTGGTGGTWNSGLKVDAANGSDVVVIGSMSSGTTKTITDFMVNGVLATVSTSTAVGDGTSKSDLYVGIRSDSSAATEFDGKLNMFAIWNRELSIPQMRSLSSDPWQLLKDPYPLSAIAAAAAGVIAPPVPTGRRRIIITTS